MGSILTGGASLLRGGSSAPRTGHSAPGGYASGWYRRGGRWDKDIGKPVGVGEDGEEWAVGDDGRVQRLGVAGPEIVVPKAPATVIPANVVNGITVPPPLPRDANQLPAGARPSLVPPPVLSGSMAVPGITGVDVPVETDRTLPPGDVSRAITAPLPRGGASRPRYVGEEPDVLTRSAETINYHQNRPLERMGKGGSFLRMTFAKLGEGMERAQAAANAQGRPVQWSDVLTGATYALGAGAGAAIDQTAVDRMRREGEVKGEQQYYGQEFQRRAAQAQLTQLESKPFLDAAQLRLKQLETQNDARDKQIAHLRELWKSSGGYKKGDPRFKDFDAQAAALKVSFPDYEKDTPPRAPITRDTRDAKGNVTIEQYDPATDTWRAAKRADGSSLISAPKPDDALVDWKLSDGRTVKISAAAAAGADAARARGTEADRKEADRIAREDARRADDEAARVGKDNQGRIVQANKLLADLRLLKKEATEGKSPWAGVNDQQYREMKKRDMAAKFQELQGYSDLVQFNNDPEWPDAAPRHGVSIAEAMRQQSGKSRAQIVDEIRASGFVPLP